CAAGLDLDGADQGVDLLQRPIVASLAQCLPGTLVGVGFSVEIVGHQHAPPISIMTNPSFFASRTRSSVTGTNRLSSTPRAFAMPSRLAFMAPCRLSRSRRILSGAANVIFTGI